MTLNSLVKRELQLPQGCLNFGNESYSRARKHLEGKLSKKSGTLDMCKYMNERMNETEHPRGCGIMKAFSHGV